MVNNERNKLFSRNAIHIKLAQYQIKKIVEIKVNNKILNT